MLKATDWCIFMTLYISTFSNLQFQVRVHCYTIGKSESPSRHHCDMSFFTKDHNTKLFFLFNKLLLRFVSKAFNVCHHSL